MSTNLSSRILYEDNHLILVNKLPGEIVQADKTGDITLADDVRLRKPQIHVRKPSLKIDRFTE